MRNAPEFNLGRLLVVAIAISAPPTAYSAPLAATFRGTTNLAASSTVDQGGVSFTIAGLSGITYRHGAEYLAAMDNSNKLVRLSIAFNADASIASAGVVGGYSLPESHDHEGIAFTGTVRNSVLLSDEDTPAVREFSLESPGFAVLQTLSTPGVYSSRRANFGFEGLSLRASPAAISGVGGSEGRLYLANEEALSVDGALSTQSLGTDVRLTCMEMNGFAFTTVTQQAHRTQPWHGSSVNGARSGVSELVALPDGRLIVVERSFAFNLSGFFQTRLYEVDLTGASETGALPSLVGQSIARISKRLIWSGDVANLEGVSLGPRTAAGAYALIGIVDDGDPISNNTLVVWELSGIQTPCAADFDWSGTVTADDIFTFLDAWFAQSSLQAPELPADVDSSGSVAADDIFAFLDLWFSQCQ